MSGISECLIGKGSRLEGNFSCAGLLRIEGECIGKLSVAGTLVIAEGAEVDADVVADNVVVAGRVRGTISAKDSIHLTSTARVKADLKSRRFKLDEGGLFLGGVSGLVE